MEIAICFRRKGKYVFMTFNLYKKYVFILANDSNFLLKRFFVSNFHIGIRDKREYDT